MKRVITIAQRKGMHAIVTPKTAKLGRPDCSHCRHSKVQVINGAFQFICKLAHALMNAEACTDFKDARRNLDSNYLRGQVNNG